MAGIGPWARSLTQGGRAAEAAAQVAEAKTGIARVVPQIKWGLAGFGSGLVGVYGADMALPSNSNDVPSPRDVQNDLLQYGVGVAGVGGFMFAKITGQQHPTRLLSAGSGLCVGIFLADALWGVTGHSKHLLPGLHDDAAS